MRKEYDFSEFRPNPYAAKLTAKGREALFRRHVQSGGDVHVDADVAAEFTDSKSVHDALRLVAKLRKIGQPHARKRRKTA
jgi:hypothetical protein